MQKEKPLRRRHSRARIHRFETRYTGESFLHKIHSNGIPMPLFQYTIDFFLLLLFKNYMKFVCRVTDMDNWVAIQFLILSRWNNQKKIIENENKKFQIFRFIFHSFTPVCCILRQWVHVSLISLIRTSKNIKIDKLVSCMYTNLMW